MNPLITVILAGLLLFNLLGLALVLRSNARYREREKYLKVALDRANRRSIRKETTIKQQKEEIMALSDRCDELERAFKIAQQKLRELESHYARVMHFYRSLKKSRMG